MRLFYLFLLFFPSTLLSQDSIARTAVIPLLTQLHDTIVYHHPIGYEADSRQAMKEALEETKDQLKGVFAQAPGDSLAVPDFILHASRLQVASGCGHLQLRPVLDTAILSAQRRHARYIGLFPVEEGDRFVLADSTLTTGGDVLERGTVVTHFEGEPTLELVQRLSAFQGLNDLGYKGGAHYKVAVGLWAYYQNYYGYRDSLSMRILDPDSGQERDVWVNTVLKATKAKPVPKKERHKDYFSLKLSEDSSAWILSVRSFGGNAFKHVNSGKLFKKTFAEIRKSGIDKLVLDLRSNGGGSLERTNKLCRYLAKTDYQFTGEMYSQTPTAAGTNLWSKIGYFLVGGVRKKGDHYEQPGKVKVVQPRRNAFKGDLVVIVNKRSFSATVMLAHVLKETSSATIIGAQTGGSRRFTYGGNIQSYTLGETPSFQLRIPNWRFEQYRPGEGTFAPHETVSLTPETLRTRKDFRIKRALEILEEWDNQGVRE